LTLLSDDAGHMIVWPQDNEARDIAAWIAPMRGDNAGLRDLIRDSLSSLSVPGQLNPAATAAAEFGPAGHYHRVVVTRRLRRAERPSQPPTPDPSIYRER